MAASNAAAAASKKKSDLASPPYHASTSNNANAPTSGHDQGHQQSRGQAQRQGAGATNNHEGSPSKHGQLPVKITTERFNCITKFAFATSVGHQPGNPNKPNQDAYVLVPNMLSQLGLHFFSVCDGHGVNGHHVSAYIKEHLPRK